MLGAGWKHGGADLADSHCRTEVPGTGNAMKCNHIAMPQNVWRAMPVVVIMTCPSDPTVCLTTPTGGADAPDVHQPERGEDQGGT